MINLRESFDSFVEKFYALRCRQNQGLYRLGTSDGHSITIEQTARPAGLPEFSLGPRFRFSAKSEAALRDVFANGGRLRYHDDDSFVRYRDLLFIPRSGDVCEIRQYVKAGDDNVVPGFH